MKIFAFTFVAFLLFLTTTFAQGDNGFLRGKGKTDVVFSLGEDYFDESIFPGHQNFVPDHNDVHRQMFSVYGAYGLTDEMDLWANVTYVDADGDGVGGFSDESGLQDLVAHLKWKFHTEQLSEKESFSILFSPGLKLPLSDYENHGVTALGDGQVDIRLRGIAHYQSESGIYAALETGWDLRTGSPNHETPINLSLGIPYYRVTFIPFYSRAQTMKAFPSLSKSFARYGLHSYIHVNDQLGFTGTVRWTDDGRTKDDVLGYSFGIVLRF